MESRRARARKTMRMESEGGIELIEACVSKVGDWYEDVCI